MEQGYQYKFIGKNIQNYPYLHFSAPNFTNDIVIGFSNDFNGDDDQKWEIVIGGWNGIRHVIRDQSLLPTFGLVQKKNPDRFLNIISHVKNKTIFRTEFNQLKKTSSLK